MQFSPQIRFNVKKGQRIAYWECLQVKTPWNEDNYKNKEGDETERGRKGRRNWPFNLKVRTIPPTCKPSL
jgi:hypothetical protein